MVAQNQAKNELRPFIPLLIGQGKLARHLAYYLSSLSIPFQHWPQSRNLTDPAFRKMLAEASAVWILVSDRAIAEVAEGIRAIQPGPPLIHSSATTEVKDTFTLHPLQTFGPELYSAEKYTQVPFLFIREEWERNESLKQTLRTLFPNPTFEIQNHERARYHAFCVMMANFPQLLWGEVVDEAESILSDPARIFTPILKQSLENFLTTGKNAITGPLVRGDLKTLALHQIALEESKLLPLYKSFVAVFSKKTHLPKEPEHDHRS